MTLRFEARHERAFFFFCVCDRVICSANKHLISACVQGAQSIQINQREVWVDGEELEAEAEAWGAGLDHYFLTHERFRAAEREFGLLFLFVEIHLPRGRAHKDTESDYRSACSDTV